MFTVAMPMNSGSSAPQTMGTPPDHKRIAF
jgi:hypothetical protein